MNNHLLSSPELNSSLLPLPTQLLNTLFGQRWKRDRHLILWMLLWHKLRTSCSETTDAVISRGRAFLFSCHLGVVFNVTYLCLHLNAIFKSIVPVKSELSSGVIKALILGLVSVSGQSAIKSGPSKVSCTTTCCCLWVSHVCLSVSVCMCELCISGNPPLTLDWTPSHTHAFKRYVTLACHSDELWASRTKLASGQQWGYQVGLFGCVYVQWVATCEHVSWPADLVIISHGPNIGLRPDLSFFSFLFFNMSPFPLCSFNTWYSTTRCIILPTPVLWSKGRNCVSYISQTHAIHTHTPSC